MNNKIIPILQNLINQESFDIINNPQQFENLLKDLAPGMKTEIHLLVNSVKEEIPQQIEKMIHLVTKEQLLAQLSNAFSESLLIKKEAAEWVINIWINLYESLQINKEKKEKTKKKILLKAKNKALVLLKIKKHQKRGKEKLQPSEKSTAVPFLKIKTDRNNKLILCMEDEVICVSHDMESLYWKTIFKDKIKSISVQDKFCFIATEKVIYCTDIDSGKILHKKKIKQLKQLSIKTPSLKTSAKNTEQNKEKIIVKNQDSIDPIRLFSNKDLLFIKTTYNLLYIDQNKQQKIIQKFIKPVKRISIQNDTIIYFDSTGNAYRINDNGESVWAKFFPFKEMLFDPIILDQFALFFFLDNKEKVICNCLFLEDGSINWSRAFDKKITDYSLYDENILLYNQQFYWIINILTGFFVIEIKHDDPDYEHYYEISEPRFDKIALYNKQVVFFVHPNMMVFYSKNNEVLYVIDDYALNIQNSPLLIEGKLIYLPVQEHRLICLHSDPDLKYDYDEKWVNEINSDIVNQIKSNKANLFFITDAGFLYSMNKVNGNINWISNVLGEAFSSPVLCDQFIYLLTKESKLNNYDYNQYKLHCIDINTGAIMWISLIIIHETK